ncbi:UNVERIFIED_CONTAM: multidrug effflux MFS transporter [Halobacillus marinus]|uniref:multidrug effflux MFS transporter n=1 Tax=Halobacillus sp. BAB-2008 TaxID=1246484 RepID=UPI0002A5189F|nr:multidrug effflux MFS transporter [Halobacillus sp. BAB-2008]ELK45926.1 Bcr/CflA subfamily drug resistance transporter [Halobacillus sp. BAB-2008]
MAHAEVRDHPIFSRSYLYVYIVILGSLSAFGPLTIDMYLPALPTLADDLGTSASIAQLSLTACLIGLALGQLFVGPFSDAKGRKGPLVSALVIYTSSSLLCMFAGSVWVFIALRFVQGLSGAAGMVISRASVRDLFSGPELTKFFSLLMLVNGLAPILAPVAGGQLLTVMSWRGVFGVLAVLGALMFLAVLFGLKETLPDTNKKSGGWKEAVSTFGLLLRDRIFTGYMLTQGFVMGSMFAYISGSTFVLQDIYGLSPQMFSLVFAINGFGLIIATQVTGRLAGKIKESSLLRYGLVQAVAGGLALFLAIFLSLSVIFLCVALFLAVSSVGIINTTVFSLAMETQGEQAGSASALLGLLPFLIGAVVSPLVGLGDGTSGMPMALVIIICELIAAAAFLIFVRPAESSKERTSE